VGVLAPFLLNMLELQPEEGLFLGPGELHAYIEGTAVEVMANSDNVLRGGLTSKHVDVRELLRVATFASGPPEILRPEGVGPGERVYRTPACEFELALVDVSRETGPWSRPRRGPELLLGLDGEATLVTPDQSHSLARGRSLFVPAAVADYRIDGSGRVCRASVPA
jgi:mannose-6-phosphate isomerase